METFEKARNRVFKGIIGRPRTSEYEVSVRGVRQVRRAAEAKVGKKLSADAQKSKLAVLSLGKLCDPKQIAKRRARKTKTRPGRFGIRSELADTPLGQRAGV